MLNEESGARIQLAAKDEAAGTPSPSVLVCRFSVSCPPCMPPSPPLPSNIQSAHSTPPSLIFHTHTPGVVTGERVVTISGPLDGVLKGVSRIMEKLHEEPELARYQVSRAFWPVYARERECVRACVVEVVCLLCRGHCRGPSPPLDRSPSLCA